MKFNWGVWVYGLWVAVVSGGANAVISTLTISAVLPDAAIHFVELALTIFGVNALFAFFLYLAKHPAPAWEGDERRSGKTTVTEVEKSVTMSTGPTKEVETEKENP